MFTFATLTGAARVAVGADLAPYYTDDAELARLLAKAEAEGIDGEEIARPLAERRHPLLERLDLDGRGTVHRHARGHLEVVVGERARRAVGRGAVADQVHHLVRADAGLGVRVAGPGGDERLVRRRDRDRRRVGALLIVIAFHWTPAMKTTHMLATLISSALLGLVAMKQQYLPMILCRCTKNIPKIRVGIVELLMI